MNQASSIMNLREQPFQIECPREHRQFAIPGAGPPFPRPIPVELDTVFVGISQIERLAHAVIGGAVERDAGIDQPAQRVGQCGTGGIENSQMVETSRSRRWWMAARAFPCVQPDVVMILAAGNER